VIQSEATLFAVLGQLDSARAVVKAALARGVDTTALLARFALIQEAMWLLPPELLPRVTQLTLADFDGNAGHYALKKGATWRLLGDTRRARAYGDSAALVFDQQLRNFPDDPELRELRGRALALAGRGAEAIQDAELSLRMRKTSLDAVTGPYVKYQVVRILVQAGEFDRALDQLEQLTNARVSWLTPGYLRLDPSLQPLRGHPRFQKLIALTT